MICRPFRTPKLMLPDRGLKTPGYNVFPFQGTVVDQIQPKISKTTCHKTLTYLLVKMPFH